MHNLLTVKETAEYLRIPLPTVYYLVQRGQFPAIQIGGRWRIKKDSLDRDILREQEQGQPTVLVIDDDTGVQGDVQALPQKDRLQPHDRRHRQGRNRCHQEAEV